MMRSTLRPRRGFTTLEIITALVIISVIGLAMTKLILNQTRSFQFDNASRRSRAAARSAMNILVTDLRMTQDNGGVTYVDVTNNRRIDVRVPVVFGFVCEVNANNIVASVVPVDSAQLSAARYGGYAVRDSVTGTYGYAAAAASDSMRVASVTRCRGSVNIYADTATLGARSGGVYILTPAPPASARVGAPMFMWQTVTYEFKASTAYPGRVGLYRVTRGLANTDTIADEVIAPFSSTARFSYYTRNPYQVADAPSSSAPASLDNIRGFQIYLPAESSDTIPTRSTPNTTYLRTAVFFKNTRFP